MWASNFEEFEEISHVLRLRPDTTQFLAISKENIEPPMVTIQQLDLDKAIDVFKIFLK